MSEIVKKINNALFSVAVVKQNKARKNEMCAIVENFYANMKKIVEVMSKRHRKQQLQVLRVERERDQQTATVFNKYYEILNLRNIREDWFTKLPKSPEQNGDVTPTVWPFLDEPKNEAVLTKTYNRPTTPLFMKRRKKSCYDFNSQIPLEPEVHVMDESKL